jgi:carbon storage regulator CsrA
MLVLSPSKNEVIKIGSNVYIKVIKDRAGFRVCIEAPKEIDIKRIKLENLEKEN